MKEEAEDEGTAQPLWQQGVCGKQPWWVQARTLGSIKASGLIYIFLTTQGVQAAVASIVTKRGVWLLLAQKPWKRPGWWKEKFTLFGGAGRADASPKVDYLPLPWQSGGNSFIGWEGVLHAEQHSQLWQSSWNWSPAVICRMNCRGWDHQEHSGQ